MSVYIVVFRIGCNSGNRLCGAQRAPKNNERTERFGLKKETFGALIFALLVVVVAMGNSYAHSWEVSTKAHVKRVVKVRPSQYPFLLTPRQRYLEKYSYWYQDFLAYGEEMAGSEPEVPRDLVNDRTLPSVRKQLRGWYDHLQEEHEIEALRLKHRIP